MGVDRATYRARIGTFICRRIVSNDDERRRMACAKQRPPGKNNTKVSEALSATNLKCAISVGISSSSPHSLGIEKFHISPHIQHQSRKAERFALALEAMTSFVLIMQQLLLLSGNVERNPGPLGQHNEAGCTTAMMDQQCSILHIAKIATFLPKWKVVAKLLGLEGQFIRDIEDRYFNGEDQRSEALMKWVRMKGPQATYRKIYDILCELEEIEAAEKVKTLTTEIPPPPPVGLKVDGITSTSVAISWQPPIYSNSIREYQVSYTMNGGNEQLHEVQDTTSTELTSLKPDTEYTIRVRAKFGDYSSPITIHTLANYSIPDPPSEVTAQSTSSKSIKVSWTLPQETSKYGTIQGYELSYSTSKDSTSVLNLGVTTFAEITGLKPNTTYTISVRTRAAGEYSEYSKPCTATTKEDVPSAPVAIVADGITATSMRVSWQPPRNANGIIRHYQISYTSHGESESIRNIGVDITSSELISLKPHTEYTVRVRAKTVEFGDYSIPITVKTRVDVPQASSTSMSSLQHLTSLHQDIIPSPPIGLRADNVSSTYVNISWQSPVDKGGFITEYQVSYTKRGGSEQLHDVQDTTSTELTSLEPDTEYTIRVRAKLMNFGEYSTPITIHTEIESGEEDDDVAYDYEDQNQEAVSGDSFASAPIDVMAQLKNKSSICAKVTWKMPKNMQNVAQSFKVFYSSSEEGVKQSKEVKELECLLEHLQPNTTYTITVSPLYSTNGSHPIKITTKQHFTYRDLELETVNLIGRGGFGDVYRSHLRGREVAIKTCRFNESELKVLSMVRHENIVEFLGFAEQNIHCAYVMELADSSLHSSVHDRNKVLDDDTITRWATDIAKGLYYLHFEAMKPKHLVHCDMKPKNVLIFKNVCKICDFGSIKHIDATATTTVYGTTIYRPPEYFIEEKYRKKAYCASDVFSYGLTLWEMLSREIPHCNKTDGDIRDSYKIHKEIPAVKDQWPAHLKSLYKDCCSLERKKRPTSKEILEMLSSAQDTSHSTNEDTTSIN